jgi:hypothetical protein
MSTFLSSELSEVQGPLFEVFVELHADQAGEYVERKWRLPGSSRWKIMRVWFRNDHSKLPTSGEAFLLDDATDVRSGHVTLSVHYDKFEKDLVEYELYIRKPAETESDIEGTGRARVRLDLLPPNLTVNDVRVRELSENPAIRVYSNKKLISTGPYIPVPKRPTRQATPFEKWLVVNNFILGSIISICVIVIVVRQFRRPANQKSLSSTDRLPR